MNEMNSNTSAPLYIHAVRQQFEQLANRARVECVVELMNGSDVRTFLLSLPDLGVADPEMVDLAERYLFADIYNILSSIGGRKMTFHCDLLMFRDPLLEVRRYKHLDVLFQFHQVTKRNVGADQPHQ